MATGAFNGQLNSNKIFGALYNMIISQTVFSDNIKGTYGDLASKFKTDGTLYGDTKLFYAVDCLESAPWGDYDEAGNLLAVKKPDAPACQKVTIDQYRMIWITLDNYLSKQAWSTPEAFGQFHSVVTGMLADTKRVYESRLINVFVGNKVSTAAKGTINVDLTTVASSASTQEESNRLQAQTIAKDIADLLVDLKDTTRDYNEYGYLRSYNEDDFYYVWNSDYYNMITKLDLPSLFHKDGLVDKLNDNVLPARYFGRALAESDFGSGKVIGTDGAYDSTKGTIRAAKEFTYNNKHYFPGDALATSGTYIGVVGGLEASSVYLETNDVICKIIHKSAVPFMSAFETETSFFNPRSLTENKYLIWGYSEPCTLYNYPFLTVKKI